MRHILELLICATIATYCMTRAWSVLPLAIAEAHALVAAYRTRWREIDAITDEVD